MVEWKRAKGDVGQLRFKQATRPQKRGAPSPSYSNEGCFDRVSLIDLWFSISHKQRYSRPIPRWRVRQRYWQLTTMEISDSAILKFLLLSEVVAVLSTNHQIRVHFYKTHVVGAVPCLDSLIISSQAEQQPSPLWMCICQHLRTVTLTGVSAGQCILLKQVLTASLRTLAIARPIPSTLKRIGSLPPSTCSSLCELTLGRPGFSNSYVTDSAMGHILKAIGGQLLSLQLIKLNHLTTDSLYHISNHCQLAHLSLLSCEGISDTLSRTPQGADRLLASQGPSLVDLDVRFSVEMNDHWLQCLMISSFHSLRTFVASRTKSISSAPMLSSAVWDAFRKHFSIRPLLYIDCVGQEGCNDQSSRLTFLHEGSSSSSSLSTVVVRPLDQRSLFGHLPRGAPVIIGLGNEVRKDSPTASCLSFFPTMMHSPLYQGMFGSPQPMVVNESTDMPSTSTTSTAGKGKGKGSEWLMCQMNEADDDEVEDDYDDEAQEEMKKNEDNGFEIESLYFPGRCMGRKQGT